MKNVWILNHYAQVLGGPGGTRHYHLAKYLKSLGWNAIVIAGSAELNTGIQRLSLTESHRYETLNGVSFFWVKTPAHTATIVGRLRSMLTYTFFALRNRAILQLPIPDIIVGSSVHPFAALAAALLARRYKVPFIFEVRDLWPQSLVDMGLLSYDSLVTFILRKLEVWLYKRASFIVVLLPFAWKYIENLGINKEKVVWIPNGVDFPLFEKNLPAQPGGGKKFTVMYFGAHGKANNLFCLLEAMKLIQDKDPSGCIQLRMIGDGPIKFKLVDLAQELKLSNVKFEPSIPKSEIPNLASQADAFVITVSDLGNLYKYGISPNKLYDYMASGRPIIFASASANNPVAESGAGVTVPPDNPIALADAIKSLSEMPQSARILMGGAGRAYVEKYHSYKSLAAQFSEILNKAINPNS